MYAQKRVLNLTGSGNSWIEKYRYRFSNFHRDPILYVSGPSTGWVVRPGEKHCRVSLWQFYSNEFERDTRATRTIDRYRNVEIAYYYDDYANVSVFFFFVFPRYPNADNYARYSLLFWYESISNLDRSVLSLTLPHTHEHTNARHTPVRIPYQIVTRERPRHENRLITPARPRPTDVLYRMVFGSARLTGGKGD